MPAIVTWGSNARKGFILGNPVLGLNLALKYGACHMFGISVILA
jgi:hypothetical protein